MPVEITQFVVGNLPGSTVSLYAPKDNEDNIRGTVIVHQPEDFVFSLLFFSFFFFSSLDPTIKISLERF